MPHHNPSRAITTPDRCSLRPTQENCSVRFGDTARPPSQAAFPIRPALKLRSQAGLPPLRFAPSASRCVTTLIRRCATSESYSVRCASPDRCSLSSHARNLSNPILSPHARKLFCPKQVPLVSNLLRLCRRQELAAASLLPARRPPHHNPLRAMRHARALYNPITGARQLRGRALSTRTLRSVRR